MATAFWAVNIYNGLSHRRCGENMAKGGFYDKMFIIISKFMN